MSEEYVPMPEGEELARGHIRVANRWVTEPGYEAFRYSGRDRLKALEAFLGLKPGSWLVRNSWGKVQVMDDENFRRVYKEASR